MGNAVLCAHTFTERCPFCDGVQVLRRVDYYAGQFHADAGPLGPSWVENSALTVQAQLRAKLGLPEVATTAVEGVVGM